MSTLKTKNIQHPSALEPALTLNPDGTFSAVMDDVDSPSLHGSTFSLRNKLINGDFSQWQRDRNFSDAGYTADRWKSSAAVSSNRVFGPQGFLYGLTVSATTTVQQPIELPLVGRAGEFYNGSTWVLSWYSTTSTITPFVQFRDDSSDETNFVNATVGAKTVVETIGSWVRYKAVVTIDVDPASTSECLSVLLSCAGATSIAGVQFEKGGLTTFEQRPLGMELSLCQRYYQKYTSSTSGYGLFGTGYVETSTQCEFYFALTVPMRSLVAGNVSFVGTLQIKRGGANYNVTEIVGLSANEEFSMITMRLGSGSTGGTTGQLVRLRSDGAGSGLVFDAEL